MKMVSFKLTFISFILVFIFVNYERVSAHSCIAGNDRQEITVVQDTFGSVNGEEIKRFTFTNNNNVSVQVISYGATITSIRVPGKGAVINDIILGFDTIDGYLGGNNPYFGASIGRVANRIAFGQFTLNGVTYNLSKNDNNKHHLHGGYRGFDKVVWNATVDEQKVTFTYVSVDGEEGYPGEVTVNITYELTVNDTFILEATAVATKSTPVNICNHAYFNLAGHNTGADTIYQHLVTIFADEYTPSDSESIPTGEIVPVAGTPFDLRSETLLGPAITNVSNYDYKGGYDYNFCINGDSGEENHVAHVYYPPLGRSLDIYSNQPGVQFYTANGLNQVTGKDGIVYNQHGAFCLETQKYPDSVNHPNFPNSILNPGETYRHIVRYQFSYEE